MMGLLKKLFLLALLGLGVYLIYAKIIKPMVDAGKGNVSNFYGSTSLPGNATN